MSDTTTGYRLPSADSLDLELEELLRVQVEDWERGTPHPLKVYLDRHPAMRARPSIVVELINQEVVLRQMRGETPRPEDYVGEFPELSDSLIRLFEVHAAASLPTEIRDGDLVVTPPVEGGVPPEAGIRLPRIPGYQVERVLGRGGMGVVYLARHDALNRHVALKLLREARDDDPAHLARFRREAAAAARCQHPNLVQIHDFDEHDGEFYLALEYVAGGHLGRTLAGRPQPPRQAAELVETLARAIDHAHAQGVVHRDLKPANVLLAPDGQPKVTDFGLAKLADSSAQTEVGTLVGTLAYMAPEQVRAGSGEIGPRTDIHALGTILYEALTGRPPYRAETSQQILHAILSEDVVPPSTRQPGIPRDLEAICVRCLEKEPARRYATAADLAEDLRRFLDGRPTEARPIGPMGRLWRWSRRNRWVAGLSAAVLASLVLGTAVSTTLAIRATRAESATGKQRDLAVKAINAMILTDRDPLMSEELQPYREMLDDEALRLSDAMLQEPGNDLRGQHLHAQALMMKAKLLAQKGDRSAAYETGKQAIELLDGLHARDPVDPGYREDLAQLLHHLGLVAIDREAARSASLRSIEIYESLARDDAQAGKDRNWAGQIALDLHNVGNAYFEEGQSTSGPQRIELIAKAIDAFREGLKFCEEKIAVEGRPDQFLPPLAYNERYLCRGHRSLAAYLEDPAERAGHVKKAIDYGLNAISHFQALAERNPENYQFAWDLHIAQRELGEMYIDTAQGNAAEAAIPHYNAARATLNAMAAKHGKLVSRMVAIQEGLAEVDYNLSMAYDNSDPTRYFDGPRREIVTEFYQICDKLGLVKPLSRNLRKAYASSTVEMVDYAELDGERIDLDLLLRAEQLWEGLFREDPTNNEARGMLVVVRRTLADELDARGRSDEAMRLARPIPGDRPGRSRPALPARDRPRAERRVHREVSIQARRSPTRNATQAIPGGSRGDAPGGGRRRLQGSRSVPQAAGVRPVPIPSSLSVHRRRSPVSRRSFLRMMSGCPDARRASVLEP